MDLSEYLDLTLFLILSENLIIHLLEQLFAAKICEEISCEAC